MNLKQLLKRKSYDVCYKYGDGYSDCVVLNGNGVAGVKREFNKWNKKATQKAKITKIKLHRFR